MRTILWTSTLALALATGACKKKQDDTGAAATEVRKTAENVDDQRKDFDKAARDKDSTPKQLDKAEGDLAAAKSDLVAAKDKYAVTARDRFAKIDIRIHELEARTDAKSKETVATLRTRRAELAARLDDLKHRAAADWENFTKDVDKGLDTVEKDLSDALK